LAREGRANSERQNYFAISFFEHAIEIKDRSNSREVREDRVRKPDCWDGVELETRNIVQE